ncbi:MAG: prolipoprotein diacylglyceryl transferase [Marmoricola sp.]
MIADLVLASIPSPSQGVWHLGAVPVRAYALCIILGVVAAVWLGEKRWIARGGAEGQVGDIALWGVPFGLVGARLYHVITDPELYFSHSSAPNHNWHPIGALEVWNGGLGIWGAIAGGVLGGLIGARRAGIRLRPMMDALAPALLLAQAIGRWGNYFNQELYGKHTDLPWGLKITKDLPQGPNGEQYPSGTTFHPTFLYECLWDLGAMGLILYLDRRLKLGFGRCFALYVFVYCVGRGWIEYLRIDDVNHILGLRLNDWTSIVLGLAALAYFVLAGRKHPAPVTREPSVYLPGREPGADGSGVTDEATVPAGEGSTVRDPAHETE